MRTGKTPAGKTLNPQFMPWQLVSEPASDDDLMALWQHFQAKPAMEFGGR